MQRAIGLVRVDDPDAAVHLRADGAAAAHAKEFLDLGIPPDQVVQVVRVLAEGLSHAAEVMRHTALSTILQPGARELETAKASQALVDPNRAAAWADDRGHAVHAVAAHDGDRGRQRQRAGSGAPLPGARHITAAFADLVGFTRLGEEVPPEELGQLANRLADMARDVAVPPVRFIKTIGDAVMFICTEPAPLLDAVLKLVDITDSDNDFPRLRAGIASGSAVSRAGDWFGSPVNTASRVTAAARPGTVLAAESVRDELGDDSGFSWSFAGPRRLKGIKGEVKLFRARRGDG